MVVVSARFKLKDETLFLTVNLVDRYLSSNILQGSDELVLVAAAALLIATKYEEIYPPAGKDLLKAMQVTKFTY